MNNETEHGSYLSELTIIIFSRDRNAYLKSAINFYSKFNINTIVVHNCKTSIADSEIPANCNYFPGSLGISQRLSQAAKELSTKYVVLTSDDEFFIPSALSKIVNKLKHDETLLSCFGQTIALNKYKGKMLGNITYSSLRTYSNRNDSILKRVDYHLLQNSGVAPIGSVYRVMKIETFKQLALVWEKTLDISSCKYIFEIIADIYLLVLGKSEYIDEIVWCRNWVNPSISDETNNRNLYFYQWWEQKEYEYQKKKFIEHVFNDLSKSITLDQLNSILYDYYLIRKVIELCEQNRHKSKLLSRLTLKKIIAKLALMGNHFKHHKTDDIQVILNNVEKANIAYNRNQLEVALLEFKTMNF